MLKVAITHFALCMGIQKYISTSLNRDRLVTYLIIETLHCLILIENKQYILLQTHQKLLNLIFEVLKCLGNFQTNMTRYLTYLPFNRK